MSADQFVADASKRVAVIIPYYQRKAGVLARVLKAALRQQGVTRPNIIVVDDGSPWPVENEIAQLDAEDRDRVTAIHQVNKGPGEARNTALDALGSDIEWIALLDSDDIWHEHHLLRALTALTSGFDFYFADGVAEGEDVTLFKKYDFVAERHRPIAGGQDLYAYMGNILDRLLQTPLLHTSSVVYRRAGLGTLRFPKGRGICEDLRFWLDVVRHSPKIAFGSRVDVTSGATGEHMSQARDWRSNAALRLQSDFAGYYIYVRRHVPLPDALRAVVSGRLTANRVDFVRTALAMVATGRMPDPPLVLRFLRDHPSAVIDFARHQLRRPPGVQ